MSEALEILKSCDAFLEGHFLLSSGRHSGAYCQMAYLQQYPDRCRILRWGFHGHSTGGAAGGFAGDIPAAPDPGSGGSG